MLTTALALLSSLVLGGEGTPAAGMERLTAPQPRDYDAAPPPASREDQALWQTAYDANNRILLERAAATGLQLRAKQGAYEERLQARGKPSGEAALRAEGLRQRLLSAWNENMQLLLRPWPVDPTRGCRYPLLNFEAVIYADDGANKRAQLASVREDLRQCVARAQLAIDAVSASNKRLEAVLAEADRELSGTATITGPAR